MWSSLLVLAVLGAGLRDDPAQEVLGSLNPERVAAVTGTPLKNAEYLQMLR